MTLDEMKRQYPHLIREIEDSVLSRLGISARRKRSFRENEDEAIPLTTEERRKIKIEARKMAGIKR